MATTLKLIPLQEYCKFHAVEISLVQALCDYDVVQLHLVKRTKYIPAKEIPRLEKALRLSRDLEINPAGVSTILNLLHRMEEQENELKKLRRIASFYGEAF